LVAFGDSPVNRPTNGNVGVINTVPGLRSVGASGQFRAFLPFAGRAKYIPHAPLFPGKRTRAGNQAVATEDFDWAKPIVVDNLYHNYFQPATRALGLGAVRFHDLRHTFATLALSAGEHYMQVSKWLGHSSYVLTLSTYADYIREDATAAPRFARPVAGTANSVVPIRARAN
jgi:integrase